MVASQHLMPSVWSSSLTHETMVLICSFRNQGPNCLIKYLVQFSKLERNILVLSNRL